MPKWSVSRRPFHHGLSFLGAELGVLLLVVAGPSKASHQTSHRQEVSNDLICPSSADKNKEHVRHDSVHSMGAESDVSTDKEVESHLREDEEFLESSSSSAWLSPVVYNILAVETGERYGIFKYHFGRVIVVYTCPSQSFIASFSSANLGLPSLAFG